MKINAPLIVVCAGLAMFSACDRGPAQADNPLALTKEQVAELEAKTKTGDYGACLQLTDYLVLEKNDPRAAAHWWQLLVDHGDAEAIVQVGQCLMRAGDFDEAEKWLLRAKENGDDSYADQLLKELGERRAKDGSGRTAQQRPAPASTPTGPAETGGPTDAAGYNARAKALLEKENLPAAIAAADRALELDPKNAEAFFLRAEAKADEGSLDAAIADYTQVIALDPSNARAYTNRGFSKGTKGDTEGLYADASRAVELDPKNPQAYFFRGIALKDKGDLDGAIADDTRAIELAPRYAAVYQSRGGAKAGKGDREGALADYDRAIEIDPKYGKRYNERADVEITMRKWTAALADYREFCELSPSAHDEDYARLFIWLIRTRLGETAAASQELQAYLDQRAEKAREEWAWRVGNFLVDRSDEAAFLSSAAAPDGATERSQRCEAWYYAGIKKLLAADKTAAAEYFQKCVGTGQKNVSEYEFARAELEELQK